MVNPREGVLNKYLKAFAEAHGFLVLPLDCAAINPDVRFRVEGSLPGEGFKPTKPYTTRLLLRDQDGNDQIKLLLSGPETVLAGFSMHATQVRMGSCRDRQALWIGFQPRLLLSPSALTSQALRSGSYVKGRVSL
jgi:hypothetical protein